jgi:hypothetical protein
VDTIKAERAQKAIEEEAKKAATEAKKTATAAKQAEARRATAIRQQARAAIVDGGERQRLPQRSRAKGNYLLLIEEDIFE